MHRFYVVIYDDQASAARVVRGSVYNANEQKVQVRFSKQVFTSERS